MHCRFVSNPLNMKLQSHVVSIVLLVELISYVSSSPTSCLFAESLNWLPQRVLDSRVSFAFLKSITVNCLRRVAGEQLIKNGIKHYRRNADSQKNHPQVARRLHRFFNFLSQRLCLADVFSSLRSRHRAAVLWLHFGEIAGGRAGDLSPETKSLFRLQADTAEKKSHVEMWDAGKLWKLQNNVWSHEFIIVKGFAKMKTLPS